jgi:hypothetical protein
MAREQLAHMAILPGIVGHQRCLRINSLAQDRAEISAGDVSNHLRAHLAAAIKRTPPLDMPPLGQGS